MTEVSSYDDQASRRHMHFASVSALALYFLLAAVGWGAEPQALSAGPTVGVYADLPGNARYSSLRNARFELRLHGCTAGGTIAEDNAFRITTDCKSISVTSLPDSSTTATVVLPAGATDFLLRAQRSLDTRSVSAEVWNSSGQGYQQAVEHGPQIWGRTNHGDQVLRIGGSAAIKIDYLRFFSTAEAVGSNPSTSPDGDLGDWEFDGAAEDVSVNHLKLHHANRVRYAASPECAPVAAFAPASNCFPNGSTTPVFCVVKAGSKLPLVAKSYAPDSGAKLTYSWKQLSGPVKASLTGEKTATATATGLTTSGEYDFQLTVSDDQGNESSAKLPVGVVATEGPDNCLVSGVPENLRYLVGPLVPWGSSCNPWPWYDQAEAGNAKALMNSFSLPDSRNHPANPGTISIDTKATPAKVTGTGTHFTKDCAGMDYAPSAPNCNNASAWIWWDAEGGKANGRYYAILQVTDDTHATITNSYQYGAPGPYRDLQYSIVNPVDVQIPYGIAQGGLGGSYNWNYYDNVIAYYRLYYRTSITAYLDHARALADAWWVYALDHGFNAAPGAPRLLALPGMMARALDGHPERWAGIEHEAGTGPQGAPQTGMVDVREVGYATSHLSLVAMLDPNVTGDRGAQARYCSLVSNSLNSFWTPLLQSPNGYAQNLYAINQSYPNYGNEVEPWQLGISATGLRDALVAAKTRCADSGTAANADALLRRTLDFTYLYGAAGNRPIPTANGGGLGRTGVFYLIGAEGSGETAHQPCAKGWDGAKPCTEGTVSGAKGSLTLRGSGTTFTKTFACNGTDFIGILDEVGVHRVDSCQGDTQLKLDSEDPLTAAVNGSLYQESPPDASTSCAPSLSTWCLGGTDPDTATILPAIFAWYYNSTGEAQYKNWGEDLFAAAYGGSAGGPGTTGPPAGPKASGQTTTAYGYLTALPPCNAASPPCGGVTQPGTVSPHWGKDFGVGSGWVGAADNFLAYRLMAQ